MIIYKTINLINNKIYVGKDIKNNSDYLGSGTILKNAIKKYGKHNFKKETIDTAKTHEELCKKEIYWIKKLNSTNSEIGYNICKGGVGGDTFTNNTDDAKNRMIIKRSNSTKGDKHWFFGQKHFKQTIEKMKKVKIGKKLSTECKIAISIGGRGITRNNGRVLSKKTLLKMKQSQRKRRLKEKQLL